MPRARTKSDDDFELAYAEARARVEDILAVLKIRFGPDLPTDISQGARAPTNMLELKRRLTLATCLPSLDAFRTYLDATVTLPSEPACIWKEALADWNFHESEFLRQFEDRGRRKAMAAAIIRIAQLRFKTQIPREIQAHIRASTDLRQLERWLEAAVKARTLNKFRQALDA